MAATLITITTATAGDIALVQRLADEVWRRHYPGIIADDQIDYMLALGYSRQALMNYLTQADAGLALARRLQSAVGFVAWYRPGAGNLMKLDKLYVLAAN